MKAVTTNDYSLLWRTLRFFTGNGFGMGACIREIDVPPTGENDIRVKVTAVALNPSDNLHADLVGNPGSILGCDFCGEVVEVGASATTRWSVGQRVAGVVHGGMNKLDGSYAEYLVTRSDLVWSPPENISDQEAATFGVSAVTAMLALYLELGVRWPDDEQPHSSSSSILVFAGSAAASLFVIQLAKLAGLTVVTTCGRHNFELVKSYGADFVYDSRSTSTLDQILQEHPKIDMAFDGLSNTESTTFCAKVVKESRGKVIILLDTIKAAKREGVEATFIMMYSVFGEAFAWLPPLGPAFAANAAAREALVRFYRILPSLIGRVKPLPTKELAQGLDNIPKNMVVQKAGVSGAKNTMRI